MVGKSQSSYREEDEIPDHRDRKRKRRDCIGVSGLMMERVEAIAYWPVDIARSPRAALLPAKPPFVSVIGFLYRNKRRQPPT